jgi:protein O-GlcNAc transferase
MKIKAKRNNLCNCGSGKKTAKCCQIKVSAGSVRAVFNKPPKKYQMAMRYHLAGELDKAEPLYREILEEDKKNPDIYLNLGQIFENKGRLDEAKICYEKALELKPDFHSAYNNMGIIYLRQEKFDQAKECFEKTLSLNSNVPEAWNNLGLVFQFRKEFKDAQACFQKAIFLKADYSDAYSNLGGIYIYQGNNTEAMNFLQKAITLNPSHSGAYNNIGNIYKFKDQLKEAETYYLKAISIKPDYAEAHNNLGNVYGNLGKIKEADASYQKALILKPDYKEAQSNLLLNLNYSSDHSTEEIFAEHLLFEKRFGEPLRSKIRPHFNDQAPDRKLKIGYVSPDFRTHSVAYFLEPVLANHDPHLFEVYCYSNSTIWDQMTRQLHSYVDYWRNITGIPDEQAAEMIRNDCIDILIDLSGHTSHNRMSLFVRKPAPIQVAWLGYPNTTGLSAIDYRITDHYADPVGMTERYYLEQLVRLPESFSCFNPADESPKVGKLPAVKNGYVTFGSFNMFAKVTPQVIRIWSEVLRAVPGSRLLLKTIGLNEAEIRETLYKMFADLGISGDRLDLRGKDFSRRDHFQRYNEVDIGLDPFPYNGTTTTCEALWMGVPVITLEGRNHAGRVGTSQMHNLGLTELIAKTEDDYIQIAQRLSGDLDHLRHLREGMRTRMISSPLMDSKRLTENLEKAYRKMWKEYVSRDREKKERALKAMDYAEALFKDGKLVAAEKIYRDLLVEEPQNIDALHNLGIIAFQNGNIELAIEFFIKALTVKPNHSVAQNNLGVAFFQLGFRREAKVCYETAITFKPDYAEAYHNLGILFRAQGDTNEAIGYFQKTLELRPDYPEAQKNLEELSGLPK